MQFMNGFTEVPKRLGKNRNGYFGETIGIADVLHEITREAQQRRWRSEIFHRDADQTWFALRKSPSISASESRAPRIYISTGIHGDEPAGPLAALRLMRDFHWPDQAEILLLPCLNPIGFTLNKRENPQGIDLNRDYRDPQSTEIKAHVHWLQRQSDFDLCLCLHEDWESHGFYLYELNPEGRPSLAESIIAAVAKVCPIDQSPIIEGREAQDGIIRPSIDLNTRPLWAESFWLLQNKTRLSYTLESPSDFPLDVRVNALVIGVQTAVTQMLNDFAKSDARVSQSPS